DAGRDGDGGAVGCGARPRRGLRGAGDPGGPGDVQRAPRDRVRGHAGACRPAVPGGAGPVAARLADRHRDRETAAPRPAPGWLEPGMERRGAARRGVGAARAAVERGAPMKPRVAVLQFPGVNCEAETVRALGRVGLEAEVFRWTRPAAELGDFQAFVLPGGFSWQDRVRAGALA